MADLESRSESPLSDIGSDAFTEEKFHRSRSPSNASEMSDASDAESATASTSTPRNMDARPVKRRRIGDYDHATPRSTNLIIPGSPAGSISSDSSGSVPTSPSFANLGPTHPLSTAYAAIQANPNDPESADYTQVTRCSWTDCPEPEQGNMDNLVQHINDVHIPPRQKKYFCEWEGCTRKSMPHTSAYALKAHMRSHTKEKPFMCQVPECDRSFTRSDALAKHMRTVHETEQLRPSDPVPKGHTGGILQAEVKASATTNGNAKGPQRLKLTMKGSKSASSAEASAPAEPKVEGGVPPLPTRTTMVAAGLQFVPAALEGDEASDEVLGRAVDMDSVPFKTPVEPSYYPPEIYADMEDYERKLPPSQWFRLLRRQLRWATEDGKSLEKELSEMRAKTDDLRGNPVTKQNLKEDEVGDAIRREEWSIVENLLERIGNATLQIQLQNLRNGDVEAAEEDNKGSIFEKVAQLPYWRKQNGIPPAEAVPGTDAA
ncbi:hypothetical protein PMZ80_001269 [Knufia obscura]|uniref:C2H2-type domain-containing protein n=2 Tax=Knufia TaxID=430999 RepID=A0AAN8EUN5_9EURO|nr:hypothetical protein PMZ80_001269 [Knufia obscura]KAK5956325.1 hypothetical protein OHC33_002901 [Knufia fluminis]